MTYMIHEQQPTRTPKAHSLTRALACMPLALDALRESTGLTYAELAADVDVPLDELEAILLERVPATADVAARCLVALGRRV